MKIVRTILKYAIIYGIAITMLLPFLWMISSALKGQTEIMEIPIHWIPETFYWENFKRAVTSFPFAKFFLNSVIVTLGIMIGQLVTSIMAAYAFARLEFKGKNFLFMLLLTALMLPAQTIMIPMTLVLKNLHLLNTLQGLIIPFCWSAMIVFLMRQFFLGIPKEIEEAAAIDGCSVFKIITNVILPISKPVIATSVILVFIFGWNQYFWPLVIVSDEKFYTLQLGLSYFKEQSTIDTDWGALMAGTALTMLPVFIVFLVFQKQVIESIAFSGSKE